MKILRICFCALIGLITFLYALLFSSACWIFYYFGPVSFWQIAAHCFESPKYLPSGAIVVIVLNLLLCAAIAASVGVLIFRLFEMSRKRIGRFGGITVVTLSTIATGLIGYELFWWGDTTFNLRQILANELTPTSLFTDYCRVTSSLAVDTAAKRKNLIVIISESLEQGFAEGLECGENLIPELADWQSHHHRFLGQKQVLGTDYTAGALMSFFYGIPKITYVKMCLDRLDGNYPRLAVPSIWDIFLTKGYDCLYCQGGDYEFASKKNLFPVHERMRLIGQTELENDPAYASERGHPFFGVQDKITIRRFKAELTELSRDERPFAAVLLTLDTHGPYGWVDSSESVHYESRVANSVAVQGRLLAELLDWLSRQPFYANTSVVVVGDHLFWYNDRAVTNGRVVYNAVKPFDGFVGFDSSSGSFSKHTAFAAFDWAPTLLELAGMEIPDGRFGLGTSLLDKTPTLLEQVGVSGFERLLQGSAYDFQKVCLKKTSEQ